MAAVSMQAVKELRDRTQAGLNDCRAALLEAEGDMEKAVDVVLKKGLAKSAKRAGAIATEGEVATRVSADARRGVIVEVNIQTDFAARNADFKDFVQRVLAVAHEASEGEDLLAKPDPKGGTLEDARQRLVATLGENITVRRFAGLEVKEAGRVHGYVHPGAKIASLVQVATGSQDGAKHASLAVFIEKLAMQVVASSPLYVQGSDVPQADKDKQIEIYRAQIAESPKPPPEQAREGVIKGKLAKWMKEICLLEQQFLDTDDSVEAACGDASKAIGTEVRIAGFVRYERGEGIEKKADDFAAEAIRMSQLEGP